MFRVAPGNHLYCGALESSSTLFHVLYQSITFAFSAQNSWGFCMDFSHSSFRIFPVNHFSLKGKLASVIFGTFCLREELLVGYKKFLV